MIFFDEKWTCKGKPYGGQSGRPQKEPSRVPAKHTVKGRVEIFASLDVRTGEVRVRCMRRRRAREGKRFLAEERKRAREQGKDLYVILDNFGSHRALRRWEERQRGQGKVRFVWLPEGAGSLAEPGGAVLPGPAARCLGQQRLCGGEGANPGGLPVCGVVERASSAASL